MDQKNWTQKVRQAIQQAIETAREAGHPQLTALHLAVALLEDPDGLAKQAVLRASNEQTYLSLLRVLKKRLVRLPSVSPLPGLCAFVCLDPLSACSWLNRSQPMHWKSSRRHIGSPLLLACPHHSCITELWSPCSRSAPSPVLLLLQSLGLDAISCMNCSWPTCTVPVPSII